MIKEWDFVARGCPFVVYLGSGLLGSIVLKIFIFSLSMFLFLDSERLMNLLEQSS